MNIRTQILVVVLAAAALFWIIRKICRKGIEVKYRPAMDPAGDRCDYFCLLSPSLRPGWQSFSESDSPSIWYFSQGSALRW